MDNRRTSSSSSSSVHEQNQIEEELPTFHRPFKPAGQSAAVVAIQENREREKRELSDLNDRFASYIERVRFLEAQNKKLQVEINHLRSGKWSSKTNKIKEKYDVEIHEARHTIDETAKDRATAELRVKRAEEETLKLKDKYALLLAGRNSDRQKIELLEKQLFDNQADLDLLHRRLIDLEEEQKRSHNESQQLTFDLQRITKDLDHETIVRIQLENQKQSLVEEIQFLKEIHSQEIEEIKQLNLLDTSLDPTTFFQNELANAVRNIRQEYEQLNQQQRNELQSWYRTKVIEAIQEIQSRRAIEKSENIREQEEIKTLRTLASDSQQETAAMRRRNGELENRVRELEELIEIERKKNSRAFDERDWKIKDLRVRLEGLGRDFDELISTKSSLDSEISIYRKLLEGEEKREGLKQIVANIPNTSSIDDESTTDSGSHQRTTGFQGFGHHDLMLTSYVPYQSLPSTGRESTIFEQVYGGGRRRRPSSISLNVQRAPVVGRLSNYRWNPSDIRSQKVKTRTFFDTGAMQNRQQPKVVTPPSSDYTDAYLSAFAPKPFPTRRIYRIAVPIFANVAPIKTLSSTHNSIRMSQTRSNNMNNIQTSNALDKIIPYFPSSSSTYSSSFIPDIFPKGVSLSNIQSSSPKTQTYKSNDSTSFRNTQSSETTIHTSSLPSSSSIPTTHRSESSHGDIDKPTPPNSLPSHLSPPATSLSSSTTISSCKPYTHQSSVNERTTSPSSNIEKHVERPETLVFQHDEDIRSPCIEKPSPIITPLLESPITRIESKIEAERTSTEEMSTAPSKPIEILEKTINKYDTIIDQISEILASVSPLSSTVSSMSPGKSVLDYELTSDGSPILQRKRIEPQVSEQSTATVRNTNIQRGKGKYLIRDDSYDKIINAIADLDDEMTPPPDNEKSTTPVIKEEKEELIASSVEGGQKSSSPEQLKDEDKILSVDQHQTSSLLNEKNEETEVLPADEQQLLSVTEGEENKYQTSTTSSADVLTSTLVPLNETNLDVPSITEIPSNKNEFVQQEPELLSSILAVESIQEETRKSNDEVTPNKNDGKHVTWGEVIVNNEDDESSSHQSLSEESSLSETPATSPEKEYHISDKPTIVVEPQISSSTFVENIITDDPVNPLTFNESSILNDEKVTTADLTEPSIIITERQIRYSSSPETSSSFSDSVDRQTSSSDLNEPRSSHDEQVTSSESSGDVQIVSAVNEQSITNSNIVSKEDADLQVEEIESNKTETPIQLVDVTENDAKISTIKDTVVLSLPIIENPINTLIDSISTQYVSSDVYHGHLGDHAQFAESSSDIDNENKKISLLASLRRTIITPATPLIEKIQTVVSSMRTVSALRPLKNENETILATPVITDTNEENNEHVTQIEENIASAYEESETVFESLCETLTDSTSTIVSNFSADEKEVLSMSSTEPVFETLSSIEDDVTTLELPSSSIFDYIQEKVPDTITTLVETMRNVLSVEKPSMQTPTTEEPILVSSSVNTLHEGSTDHLVNASVPLTSHINIDTSTNQHKEQISSNPDTIMIESLSLLPVEYIDTTNTPEIVDSTSVDQEPEELKSSENKTNENTMPTPIIKDGEQVLTTDTVSSEQIDDINREVTQVDIASAPSDFNIFEHDTINTYLNEITHPLVIMSEKIDRVVSPLPTEEDLLLVEQDFAPTNNEYLTSTETIRASSSPSAEKEPVLTLKKPEFHPDNKIPDEEQISATTVLSQISDDGVTQSTTPQQPSATDPLIDDVSATDKMDIQITSTDLTMTKSTSLSETDEPTSTSVKEKKIIQNIIDELINNITQNIVSQFQQNAIGIKQDIASSDNGLTRALIPPIDHIIQQPTTELPSDSRSSQPEMENIPSVGLREISPTNTEPDSSELIHALHGHSIVLDNLSEKLYHLPEKSLSATTSSSQITSSDRYVSYVIHQMGDSSQDHLPAFPIATDIPLYKTPEENLLIRANPPLAKEEDSTEFDATDNLTSYSDDLLLQRLPTSVINRQKHFDLSSTDDDVDDEIEQHDLTDLERIIDKLSQPNNRLSINEEPYQRYDLATTPSSHDSSSSPRQQADDIYFIPGYSGLWRPSAYNNHANLPIDYDADDERKTTSKTRMIPSEKITTFRTLISNKRPLSFQYHQIEPRNLPTDAPPRASDEFSLDISESDSYQTCPSSISKQVEPHSEFHQSAEQHQTSPDEDIFLIHQPERRISLPITMNINCDDSALRLSASSPIDTQLYSPILPDLTSPLLMKTDSNSRLSSPLSISHEQKLPSWLDTVNTITTKTEGSDGPLESCITLLKSAKGPISISECHPKGNYIIIENTSRSKTIDLINWKIQQENDNGDNLIFVFPDHCLLRPNHSLKILTKINQSEPRNDDLIVSSISSWHTGPHILTTLINPEGKDCATLTKETIST